MDLIRGLYLLATSGDTYPSNLGNPDEFTLLELANTVLKVTRCVQPDRLRGAAGRRSAGATAGHHAQQVLGWSRRWRSRKGYARLVCLGPRARPSLSFTAMARSTWAFSTSSLR